MKTPIIPIERASEETIKVLIDMGVLEVTGDGLKVKEQAHEKKSICSR